ncbi:MAG: ribose-phosphate pyrophosphokinase [Candidatus Diapherotrites archaeon]
MKDVVLLADPKTSAWDFANKIKDYIKEKKEKEISLLKLEMTRFRDKENLPYVPENIRKKDVYFIQSPNKHPNNWWVELLLVKDLCLSASVNSLSFVLSNMRYSRQDRKHRSRVPVSSRALANSISPGLQRIITMDLHSPQIQNAYPANVPLDNLHSFPEAVKYLRQNHFGDLENLVLVSPDAGGVHRTMSYMKKLIYANADDQFNHAMTGKGSSLAFHNYSFAMISKIREKPGEIEKMILTGDVKDKNVLIVDDIYDSCGTSIEAGKLLREEGAKKLLVYATHGLFTKGTKEILENFDIVMTSNTHYKPSKNNGNIEIIDMTPIFAEAIYRAQEGLSISKLFD